jgi:uncharacterized membrane protein YebE (DUF533 family)
MGLDNILGQLLSNGMRGQSRSRLENVLGPSGLGGSGSGGLGQVLGGLLGGSGRSMGTGGLGGLGGLGGAGGLGGLGGLGGSGGLGAIAGALLGGRGGSARGALGGSAMAVLAAMAMNALQNRSRQGGHGAANAGDTTTASVTQEDLQSMVTPQVQALLVRAMISAAKADGQIDQAEMQRIMGKIGDDGVTDEERREIADELARPLDVQGLIAAVPDEKVAAQIYGASLLSIDIDTESEKNYLRQLSQGLGLDPAVVQRLHEMSGAPMV